MHTHTNTHTHTHTHTHTEWESPQQEQPNKIHQLCVCACVCGVYVCAYACKKRQKEGEGDTWYRLYALVFLYSDCMLASVFRGSAHGWEHSHWQLWVHSLLFKVKIPSLSRRGHIKNSQEMFNWPGIYPLPSLSQTVWPQRWAILIVLPVSQTHSYGQRRMPLRMEAPAATFGSRGLLQR